MGNLKSLTACAVALLTIANCKTISLTVPSSRPSIAPVDHSFPAFAINGVDLPDFAGNKATPGVFSRNLIQTIANRTGAAAQIRCGGTKLDHSAYNASLKQPVKTTGLDEKKQNIDYYIGPSFFDSFATWPGVKWTYQVPIPFGGLENTLALARQGLKAIGASNLESLEIGNEPRQPVWNSPEAYVKQWLNYSTEISQKVDGLPQGRIYQGLALAAEAPDPWNIPYMFKIGVNNNTNLKTVSHHYYEVFLQDVDNKTNTAAYLQNTLLNHSHLVQNASNLKVAASFLKQNHPDIGLVLGEVDSGYPKSSTSTKDQRNDVLSSLGTALWLVDFHLYMMSLGVKRISNQLGAGWRFSPWTANVSANQGSVHAPYYGIAFVADAIGADTSSKTRVLGMVTNSSDTQVTAYAFYKGSTLSKVALLNLEVWVNGTHDGERPVKEIELTLPAGVGADGGVKVQKLTGKDSFDQFGATWAGEKFTFKSHGLPEKVRDDTETVQVKNGRVAVSVNATEAVLLTF